MRQFKISCLLVSLGREIYFCLRLCFGNLKHSVYLWRGKSGESGKMLHILGAAALLALAPWPSCPKQSLPRTRTWAKPPSPVLPGARTDAHPTSSDLPNRHRESETSATPTYLGHGGGGHSPRPLVHAHSTLPRALAEAEATSGAEAGRAGKGGMACGFRRSIACQVLSRAASRREPGPERAA